MIQANCSFPQLETEVLSISFDVLKNSLLGYRDKGEQHGMLKTTKLVKRPDKNSGYYTFAGAIIIGEDFHPVSWETKEEMPVSENGFIDQSVVLKINHDYPHLLP